MKCPVCNNSNHNEIDLHSDGYAKDIIQCSTCGTLWLEDQGFSSIIKKSTAAAGCSSSH